MKEFQFTSADGLLLQGTHWTSKKPAKAVIQISHGMAEHIGRYDSFARYMTEHGYHVFGHSHRGHGKTAKNEEYLGYLAKSGGWELLVDDLLEATKMIKDNMADLPVILMGHSMGSFAARNALRKQAQLYDAAIIMGSAWQNNVSIVMANLIAQIVKNLTGEFNRSNFLDSMLFGNYNDDIVNSHTKFDWLSRDREMVKKYIDDPYCGYVCTTSFYCDLINAVSKVMRKNGLDLIPPQFPILITSGDKDPVGAYGKGVQKLANNYKMNGKNNVTVQLYKDGRHELLNEMNRMVVFEDLLAWMNSNIDTETTI